MANNTTFKVSKTDAARRQLETAVRLWFFSGDPVAIHTLAAAAHQVLHDLGKKQGAPTLLRDLPGVKPEYTARVRQAVSKYENFFKHADDDPDGLLDFNPEGTEAFLVDAVLTYEKLTQENAPILATFKTWFFLHHPDLLQKEAKEKLAQVLGEEISSFVDIPKAEFFTQFLSYFMRQGIT